MTANGLVFSGPITHPATTKLRNAICGAVNGVFAGQNNQKCEKLFLLMNSSGGSLDDGFSLYNLLRTIQTEVVTVNMGQIASIANVPFLAGSHRIACPHSYFHFHNFDWNYPSAHTLTRQQFTDHTQLIDIARVNKKALFKAHTKLTEADFETLKFLEEPLVKDAAFAKAKGIVQEIAFPVLPAGTPIFNVDY
ncbi:MAG: ATP-dependent Clp protease proteolytic subunit [Burkholderiales bacterium]